MLNKVLLILLVILIAVLAVVSITDYQNFRTTERARIQAVAEEKKQKEQSRAEALDAREEALDIRSDLLLKEEQRLNDHCESLADVYDKLTPFQKLLTEKVECILAPME